MALGAFSARLTVILYDYHTIRTPCGISTLGVLVCQCEGGINLLYVLVE